MSLTTAAPGDDGQVCRECGAPCFVTDAGVAHHYSEFAPDEIDHDADADHVAIPEPEEEDEQ